MILSDTVQCGGATSELFEERGLDAPGLVFFFDEAHLVPGAGRGLFGNRKRR